MSGQTAMQVLPDLTISVNQNFRIFIEIKCFHLLHRNPEDPIDELPGHPLGSFYDLPPIVVPLSKFVQLVLNPLIG